MPSLLPRKAEAFVQFKPPAIPESKEAPPASSNSIQSPTVEDLTAGFANISIPSPSKIPGFPTEPLAIAHLKLLHAFAVLKEDVGFTDGLFGIWDSRAAEFPFDPKLQVVDEEDPDVRQVAALAKIREKRWALYVARATERFAVYWTNVLCTPEHRRLKQADMLDKSFELLTKSGVLRADSDLPPLGEHCIEFCFYAPR